MCAGFTFFRDGKENSEKCKLKRNRIGPPVRMGILFLFTKNNFGSVACVQEIGKQWVAFLYVSLSLYLRNRLPRSRETVASLQEYTG